MQCAENYRILIKDLEAGKDQLEELGPQVWDLCISELIVRAVLDLYDGPKRE